MAKPIQIQGYELLGLLGRGGMGDVYRAKQASTGRLCAIKVTRSDRTDEKARARFRREAEAMAQVDHPHLIKLYDSGQVGDDLWIAIELIDGGSLDRVLAAQGALSPELSSRLMFETCQALTAMHQQGILHRDVKPANIMIEKESGRAVLMDLGLAKDPTKTGLTQTGHLLGTPVYLPKEVFTGVKFDPSVDFYSVGISWWELLSGERPYDFQQMMDSLTKGIELVIPPPRSPHGEIPPRHLSVIQALTDERDVRPASWQDVEALLEGRPMPVRSGRAPGSGSYTRPLDSTRPSTALHGPSASTISTTSTSPEAPPRSRMALAIPSLGLALLGVFGMLFSGDGTSPGEEPRGGRTGLPVAETLLFERTWADRHSVVFQGAAPVAEAVRVSRRVDGREVPVPVYVVGGSRFLVWATGLEPGTAVEVTATDGSETMGARAASVRAGDPSVGDRFPLELRRFHPNDDAPVLRRQFEGLLEIVDTPEALDSEVWATFDISLFKSFPDALWPAILALLEREGPVVESLLRCMKLAQTTIPPEVAWHLTHRLADPAAPLSRLHHLDIEADWFEGCGVPLALPGRLEEWGERDDLATTSLFRMAGFTATRLGDTPKVKVFPGDAWDEDLHRQEPVDPLEVLGDEGLAGLMADAVRARRGEPGALDRLLQVALEPGSSSGDWALVLVGTTGDEGLIEVVLDEYARADGRRELAARSALMALRTQPGFWTPTDRPMLLRVGPDDLPGRAEGARTDGDHTVVWKPGRTSGFALVPGKGAVLRIRLTSGEEVAYQLRAKGKATRIE